MSGKLPIQSGNNNCSQMLGHLLDQEGDNGAAILSLLDRYVNHFARTYCDLSFHERQDIRQEVAISLLCHGSKVRESCSRSWIYTVVRNQCINHVRKKASQLAVMDSSDDPEINVSGYMPAFTESADAGMFQQVECLQKIFDRIESQETGKADISIYTQYAFGFSYDEISKCTMRSVDAVGRRISVLKGRLKKLIDECC